MRDLTMAAACQAFGLARAMPGTSKPAVHSPTNHTYNENIISVLIHAHCQKVKSCHCSLQCQAFFLLQN